MGWNVRPHLVAVHGGATGRRYACNSSPKPHNAAKFGGAKCGGKMAENSKEEMDRQYWRANLRLMGSLLIVWFAVSFGAGILLVDWLDQFRFFGFKLGFWFAQQGSIYVFVALIFVYVVQMNRLDRKFNVDEEGDA